MTQITAYVFPGQGAQFPGMAKELYETNAAAKQVLDTANDILGFDILNIMFNGTEEDLRQTRVTQPAVFLHSMAQFVARQNAVLPNMVAGHSLGEFSALAAAGVLSLADALKLVSIRAGAMQKACENTPGTMAAILGLDDATVESVCAKIENEVVVAANYNSIGQVVISGTINGVEAACIALKGAGAKRTIVLSVGGAFHSPLMQPAAEELKLAINAANFSIGICPIYQNVNGLPCTNSVTIKENLIAQLTSPVRWTKIIENMVQDGANHFIECGPGNVLQGLIKKINKEAKVFAAI